MSATRHLELIEVLAAHGVEFVVIGGTAAVLHGAPYTTFDVDVVYSRAPENLNRLLAALSSVGAEFHDLTGRHLPPTLSLLALPSPKLLRTRIGRIDVLGELDPETSWEALLADSVALDLGFASGEVRVISLPRLIAVKQKVARPRDLALLPILRAMLERRG